MTYDVHPPRALAALTLALTLTASLAACGSDEPEAGSATPTPSATSSRPAPSSGSPTAASAAPSSTRPSAGDALEAAQFSALVDAAFDDSSGAHLSVDNGLGLLSGNGTADFRERPTALAMTLTSTETGDDQQLDVRVLGDTLYVANGKRWLRVDIESPANPFGSSLADQLDPRRVLEVVAVHLASATRGATTRHDGERLTSYRVTADGPAVAQALAPDLAGQEGVVVPPDVTCDLVVDGDGRARSITLDLGDENGQLVYTLTDWSDASDLTVSEPPAGQVDELSLPTR